MPNRGQTKNRGLPIEIADKKYKLTKKIGAGCFGEVYIGTTQGSPRKKEVAAKCEQKEHGAPLQLEHESEQLKKLQGAQGFAEWYYFGKESFGKDQGEYQFLVMESLGSSLEDRLQKCGGKFSAATTALVGEQVLHRIEYLHSKGIVHRDIKPENFMFGKGPKQHIVFLIDFGLSKDYWKKGHVTIRQKLSLTGTARYASINAHKGIEQSRRDDLEAIGHMFMYFLRGSLPWSGLDAKNKQEKYQKICDKKAETPLQTLCDGHPEEFRKYLEYSRKLKFDDRPDYDWMSKLMRTVASKAHCRTAYSFSWFDTEEKWHDLHHNQQPPLVELLPRGEGYKQPDDKDTPKPKRKRRKPDGLTACFFTCCRNKSED